MPRLILGRNAASPPLLKSKTLQRMLHAAKLSYGFTARLNQLRLIPVDSSRMLYLKLFLMPCTDLGCVNQVYKKDAPTIIVGAFHFSLTCPCGRLRLGLGGLYAAQILTPRQSRNKWGLVRSISRILKV